MGGKTMNKTYLCVLPLTVFLAASSGYSVAQETECAKDPAKTHKCKGDPNAPIVNLNLNTMKASPHCILAKPGTTLVFTLTPRKNLKRNTVEILPKDDFDEWLQGKNEDFEDLIIIRIPHDFKPSEEPWSSDHAYSIRAPGKCLDPRVHVEH
jgi:hypothetical protein